MNYRTQYLNYVLKHKYYVAQECFRYGLIRQGIIHDTSKFLPVEFEPYAKTFCGGWKYDERPAWLKVEFDWAWKHHQSNNPHHWQYWLETTNLGICRCTTSFDINSTSILVNDNGPIKCLKCDKEIHREYIRPTLMPFHFIKEMVSDWIGAGKTLGKYNPNNHLEEVKKWYGKNRNNIIITESTRKYVEGLIQYGDES